MLRVLLVSTYDLGRQPFGLASPAAWLRRAGFDAACMDLAAERLDPARVREADLIAFHLPMHTATRIAVGVVPEVRRLNPAAHLCFYGLYAPMNAAHLHGLGGARGATILGGEFEEGLVNLARRLSDQRVAEQEAAGDGVPPEVARNVAGGAVDSARGAGDSARGAIDARDASRDSGAPAIGMARWTGPLQPEPVISVARQDFVRPDRTGLPPLDRYARFHGEDGQARLVAYTEASRGCRHLCRHCPVVPVYDGRFRIVPLDVVRDDVRQQVEAGAEHVTFGDPDFFNGVTHALAVVRALHREHPRTTYDVTIKIEHLLRHARHLPILRETGCALVTSAVESIDDRVLAILDKGHSREDFVRAVELLDAAGLSLNPTFIPFTPWTSIDGYRELLDLLETLGLEVGSSRVDLQACKLEYSIVSPK